jgi:hypothetical protein
MTKDVVTVSDCFTFLRKRRYPEVDELPPTEWETMNAVSEHAHAVLRTMLRSGAVPVFGYPVDGSGHDPVRISKEFLAQAEFDFPAKRIWQERPNISNRTFVYVNAFVYQDAFLAYLNNINFVHVEDKEYLKHQCITWIGYFIERSPSIISKGEIFNHIKERGPSLERATFERAWEEAKRAHPEWELDSPGRPAKKGMEAEIAAAVAYAHENVFGPENPT